MPLSGHSLVLLAALKVFRGRIVGAKNRFPLFRTMLSGAFLLVPITPAPAIKVSAFLARAEALQAQGPFALLSSDLPRLQGELRAAVARLRAESVAARRAGRPPAFCLPPPGEAEVDMATLLAHLRAIPRARAVRTELRDALRPLAARRYPCRR